MGYHYTSPGRERDPRTLPDLEVFWADAGEWAYDDNGERCDVEEGAEGCGNEEGFYWWACFPGCLPDSDPHGPFATEEEALADAREGYEDDDDGQAAYGAATECEEV